MDTKKIVIFAVLIVLIGLIYVVSTSKGCRMHSVDIEGLVR